MASIVKLGKGKQPPRAIDFVGLDGKRKRIRLGIVTLEQTRQAKLRVEKLVAAKKLNQTPDSETVTWLGGVSGRLHDRIARVGLCPPREPTSACPTLAGFLEKYIEQRCHELEPSSVERLENTRDRLQRYFGSELPLDQITPNMTARSFTSQDVLGVLQYLFAVRGRPAHIRSDNGPEFVAKAVRRWLAQAEVGTLFIAKGSPGENGYVESAGGKLRDELLNRELFLSWEEACWVIDRWRLDYNHYRIHSALNYQAPAAFAANCVLPASAMPQPPEYSHIN